jgi:hypothetical protein
VQRPPQHGDLLPEKSNTKKSQKTKHIQAWKLNVLFPQMFKLENAKHFSHKFFNFKISVHFRHYSFKLIEILCTFSTSLF